MIRALRPDREAAACDAIIASLPDLFGMEEGIRECAEAVRTQSGLVAEIDGSVVGFLTLSRPYPRTRRSLGWPCMHAIDVAASAGR